MAESTKSQRTASRMADAASKRFFSRGFDDTTIAQIAADAGVAPGTVMLHFGSKSDLATAAFSNEIGALVAEATQISQARRTGDVGEDLATFIRPLYTWYRKHGDVAPALLQESLFSQGQWADHYTATVAKTVEVLATIAAPHLPEGSDLATVGEGLLADYLLTLLRGLQGDYSNVTEQVERFVSLALTRFAAER